MESAHSLRETSSRLLASLIHGEHEVAHLFGGKKTSSRLLAAENRKWRTVDGSGSFVWRKDDPE